MGKQDLLERLEKETRVVRTEPIRHAFRAVDRKDFVGDDYQIEAYEDYALPIGYGQTISQPTTVAFMLELLGADVGDKVLDVGSGSGYTTALLADIVDEEGSVIGVEVLPELVDVGTLNLKKYPYRNARIVAPDSGGGHKAGAPYDRILVSAAAPGLPMQLFDQLRIGGTMVIPIENSIVKLTKTGPEDADQEEYPGFVFVPLV